jgi:dGTP triphosphohydrolase
MYKAQYNAWCRNNGTHYTAKRGNVRWNAELLWKQKQEQAFAWDMLEEEISEICDALEDSIKKSLMDFQSLAEGMSPTLPHS